MPEAPKVDDPPAPAGLIAAWRRSSDLRFYLTSLIVAADIILVVSMVRAREEPPTPTPRRRPTESVYADAAPRAPTQPTPGSADPLEAPLTLDRALDGVPGAGPASLTIETSRGSLRCALWTERAPQGVALLVGLARGVRPYWDGVAAQWSRAPFYDGSVIFRVVPGALIEGGGPTRSAEVAPGFEVPIEVGAPHDRAGLLSLTRRGTLQVIAAPRPELDGQDAIVGACEPAALVDLMTDVRAQGERPTIPIFLRAVRVTRGA